MFGYWFVSAVFNVGQMFLKSNGQGASSLTDVQFRTNSAVDDIDQVSGLAVEEFSDGHT